MTSTDFEKNILLDEEDDDEESGGNGLFDYNEVSSKIPKILTSEEIRKMKND
jgi:hypothetical protein